MLNLLQNLIFGWTFYVTIADSDIEHVKSIKSIYTLFDTYLDHMLVNLEQNRLIRILQNLQKFELFDKERLTILCKMFMSVCKTFL